MENFEIYDITTDTMRLFTKADFELYQKHLEALTRYPRTTEFPPKMNLDFKLALYGNRMRPGESFVAEAKEIKPYEGITGFNGELCYPATPDTPYRVGMSLPNDFAAEIVRRWNEAAT